MLAVCRTSRPRGILRGIAGSKFSTPSRRLLDLGGIVPSMDCFEHLGKVRSKPRRRSRRVGAVLPARGWAAGRPQHARHVLDLWCPRCLLPTVAGLFDYLLVPTSRPRCQITRKIATSSRYCCSSLRWGALGDPQTLGERACGNRRPRQEVRRMWSRSRSLPCCLRA